MNHVLFTVLGLKAPSFEDLSLTLGNILFIIMIISSTLLHILCCLFNFSFLNTGPLDHITFYFTVLFLLHIFSLITFLLNISKDILIFYL